MGTSGKALIRYKVVRNLPGPSGRFYGSELLRWRTSLSDIVVIAAACLRVLYGPLLRIVICRLQASTKLRDPRWQRLAQLLISPLSRHFRVVSI